MYKIEHPGPDLLKNLMMTIKSSQIRHMIESYHVYSYDDLMIIIS